MSSKRTFGMIIRDSYQEVMLLPIQRFTLVIEVESNDHLPESTLLDYLIDDLGVPQTDENIFNIISIQTKD